jgi:D-glycero-alpha-D-manno-heptose 1-phosphate guanylyltransferase
MKALILCGGMGTRLRGVIGATQKAVALVDGKPFLALVVEQLELAGVDDLVFCTHYQSEQVEAVVDELADDTQLTVAIVREPQPMGTGGAILNALHELEYGGPLIALNADTYVDAHAYRMAVKASAPFVVVTEVPDCSRYGAIVCDASKRVTRITEKGVSGPGWISAGVYRLDAADLQRLPVQACSMENDIIPGYIQQGALAAGHYQGPFIDIGTPDSLRQIREHGVQEIR